ncbi:terminase small subunit [Salmonella enterica]|nr:terminase small subunit [Salmonella enterica subsp. enterica serovar Javiana]EDA0233663.1 terminase small subunit [Salmonella enterica]EEK4999064.1 terminase small subunit [Salmonella enterica]EFB0086464.1 terminase small subunit [Salmonella enterica]
MSRPDESSLKSDYCAGVLSIQKVAVKHNIAKSTLIDMAKKYQWVREKNPTKKSDQNENGRTDGREKKYLKNSDEKNPGNFPSDNRYSDSDYTFNPDDFGISEHQGVFAEYVAAGKSLAEAYRLAGYQGEGNTIYVNASRLLRNAKVYRAIRWLRDRRQRRLALTEEEIIHQLSAIASADPNEISHIRRVNCRYCWGKKHQYQWRDMDEYHAAREKALDGEMPEYGGIGFFDSAVPNPECPRCGGEGIPDLYFADTTMIDGPARWLVAGVRQTMNGIEVKITSQEAARRELLRILERRLASKPEEPQIPGEDYRLQELTPDEAVPPKPVL